MDRIYIPTYKRVADQITLNSIPDKYRDRVVLVVQDWERDQYNYDCEYLVVPDHIGIAKTRVHIYEHAGRQRYGMLDDDTEFVRKNYKYFGGESDMETSGRKMTESDFDDMFETFNTIFDNENVLEIGMRSMSVPPADKAWFHNKAVFVTHWIDGEKLYPLLDDMDLTISEFGEDVVLCLEYLTRGYQNRICNYFGRQSVYEQPGGCNDYRTRATEVEEQMKILEKFPHLGRELSDGEIRWNYKLAYQTSQTESLETFFE